MLAFIIVAIVIFYVALFSNYVQMYLDNGYNRDEHSDHPNDMDIL